MTDEALAQDPAEPFDVVLADGSATGRTKARALVHRDGDWHRSVHVWVAGVAPGEEEDGAFLIFQRRGLAKDTSPGRLDATVGGHLRAGEGIAAALREVEEEIGVAAPVFPDPAAPRRLGTRLAVTEGAGVRDRELQAVFLLRDDRPLTGYRPHPAELAALIRVPLALLLPFLAGDDAGATIAAEAIAPGESTTGPIVLGRADFIPSVDRYFYRVAIAAAAALRGERHVAV